MLSYFNVKKAMDYYISKGGSAKFIICDDGFQVRAIPDVSKYWATGSLACLYCNPLWGGEGGAQPC